MAATLMRQTVQAMAKDIDGRLREHQLTLVQRRALTLLSEGQVVTPGNVSLALEVDTGATARLLDRVAAKGMYRRHRDSTASKTRSQIEFLNGIGRGRHFPALPDCCRSSDDV